MSSTSDKWKHFERLVAAIHRTADEGAEVRWNETIHGRQFDVTIRFRKRLCEYLTVIECKNYETAVPVEKVEAFATKAADVQAHHAVMASTSGFQVGAQEVARKHNMTLIHITDSSDIDLSVFGARWAGTADILHFESIELEYADGERKLLPKEAHALTYYVHQVLLECRSTRASLNDLIQSHAMRFLGGEIDVYKDDAIACPSGTRVVGPDDGDSAKTPCLRSCTSGHYQSENPHRTGQLDLYLMTPDVKVRNVATGEEQTFSPHQLALGVNNVFEQGKFYEQPQLAMYYFCESVKGDLAHLYLLESFQHGRRIQAELRVKTEYANLYVPTSDKLTIRRLQRRLDLLKGRQTKR